MAGTRDKIKGTVKEAAGKAQKAWGEATDQPEHEVEGAVRETEGKAQKGAGKVKEKVEKAKDDLTR